MVELTDDRLTLVLRSVGEHLDIGVDGTAPVAGARPFERAHRWHRPILRVAAVVLAIVALALALAPVRRSVAGWLSIGRTEITMRVDEDAADLANLPELQDGSRTISEREASMLVDTAAVSSTALGPPPRWAVPLEGGMLAVWPDGATTLWVQTPDFEPDLRKVLDVNENARLVDDLGDAALTVTGEHELFTPSRRLAAGTVLLWTDGRRHYRLESDLPLDEMISIARAIDAGS